MVLRRSDGSAAKGKDARSRGVPGNRPESVSNVHRGECDPAVAGLSTEDLRDKLRDELGDVLWYVSNMALDLGYTLEEIAEANQRKLEARYAGKAHAEIKVAAIGTEGFSEVGYSPVREFDRDGDAYRYKFDGSH